jgi:hypothetical protein
VCSGDAKSLQKFLRLILVDVHRDRGAISLRVARQQRFFSAMSCG